MPTLVHEPAWLTVKEAASRLGFHEITVRRKIARGELRALQLGGPGAALRILESDLQRFIYDSWPVQGNDPALARRVPNSGQSIAPAHGGEAA